MATQIPQMNDLGSEIIRTPGTTTNKWTVFPVELMSMIFHWVHLTEFGLRALNALRLVCRLWNDVILKDTILWTDITLPSKLSKIQKYIARSGQAPLFVRITADRNRIYKSAYITVFKEYHRIRTLHINLRAFRDRSEKLALVREWIDQTVPARLEALHLFCVDGQSNDFSIFTSNVPRLREFYMEGIIIPPLFFTSLRVLDVRIDSSFYSGPSDELFELFRKNPQLEIIKFILKSYRISPPFVDHQTFRLRTKQFESSEKQTVCLPNLKSLSLSSNQPQVAGILQRLVLPSPLVRWNFGISYCDVTSVTDIFIPSISQTPLDSLELHIGPIAGSAGFNVSLAHSYHEDKSEFMYRHSQSPIAWINTVLPKLNFTSIRSFVLSLDAQARVHLTDDESNSIRSFFKSLVNLRGFQFRYPGWNDMDKFKGLCLMNLIGSDDTGLPCPLLDELVITGPGTSSLAFAEHLKMCLLSRSVENCPLTSVILFSFTSVNMEVRNLLSGLVQWK